jgi:hypothetical protein
MIEWIDDLERYAAPSQDIPAAYSALVESLIAARLIKEDTQFLIGDMLIGQETVYAERTIAGLAGDVGLSPQSLYDYRDTAAFYPADIRARYRSPLSYSHLKTARKLKDMDKALSFLDACVENVWSVAAAQMEIKRVMGKSVPDAPVFKGPCTFCVIDGWVTVDGLQGVEMEQGKRYAVTIREEGSS